MKNYQQGQNQKSWNLRKMKVKSFCACMLHLAICLGRRRDLDSTVIQDNVEQGYNMGHAILQVITGVTKFAWHMDEMREIHKYEIHPRVVLPHLPMWGSGVDV